MGHFLGHSSASLGLTKISESCEAIKKYGARMTPEGEPAGSEECLSKIQTVISDLKPEYEEVKKLILEFYKSG